MDITKLQKKFNLNPDNDLGPKTFSAIVSYAVGRPVSFDFRPTKLTTPQRLADFIAQTAHETGNFKLFEENLNYASAALLKQWPNHFSAASAAKANRNPELIAEIAYGTLSRTGKGRMGNTQAGDGWKYRGRGALQLTGRANYALYSRLTGLDLVNLPEQAKDPSVSLKIAEAFYTQNHIWEVIDKGDTVTARKKVNGGTLGLAHVNDVRAKVLSLFA